MEQRVVMRCFLYLVYKYISNVIYKDTTNSVEDKSRNNIVFAPQDHSIPLISRKRTGFKRLQSSLNLTESEVVQKIIWDKVSMTSEYLKEIRKSNFFFILFISRLSKGQTVKKIFNLKFTK